MIIVVRHQINNPAEFWKLIKHHLPELPVGGVKRVVQILPNRDMTEATCIWEAETIAALDVYLRKKVFNWSTESYYELNVAEASGISL